MNIWWEVCTELCFGCVIIAVYISLCVYIQINKNVWTMIN